MRLVIGQLWADLENERRDEISSSVAGFGVGGWAVEWQQSTTADGSFDRLPLESVLEYGLGGYM